MPTILAMNPKKKKKKKTKRVMSALQKKYFGTKAQRKEVNKMAKKKKPGPKKGTKKAAKIIYRKSKATLGGINMLGAAKSTVPLLFGALVAKGIAKRFATGGGEGEPWSYKNFLLALAGGFGAALLTRMLIKRGNAAQKVFEGSLLLIGYKLVTTKLAPMTEISQSWLGAPAEELPYGSLGAGDMWTGRDEDYVQGVDGRWRPISESHRAPNMGDVEVIPNPRYGYGDVEVIPNRRYGGIDNLIEAENM